MLKSILERVGRLGRGAQGIESLSDTQTAKLSRLQKDGYVTFDHLVGSAELESLRKDYTDRLEQKLDVEYPCLAQSRINPVKHKGLIDSNFLASPAQLAEQGLTFDRADAKSYAQVVEEFAPSTLTMSLPSTYEFFNAWLHPDIIAVTEAYFGFTPVLTEAYIRRNFPARFSVMNHAWHRDRNHTTHLLKAFVFLSDCTLETGPHHYIAGSAKDAAFRDKNYYSSEEVRAVYPPESGREIVSIVPAGTIILEDTRGLHRAGIPERDYRDLGFATFLPPIALVSRDPLYKVSRSTVDKLAPAQRKFISSGNIVQ